MNETKKTNIVNLPTSRARRRMSQDVDIKQPIELDDYLPYRVFALSNKLSFSGKLDIDGIQISSRDWRILLTIVSEGPSTNQKIADLCFMDSATISRAVTYLKEVGLISVRRSRRDKRKVLVGLTQKGADVYDLAANEIRSFVTDLEEALGPKELSTLFDILNKIDDVINADRIEYEDWVDLEDEN